MEKKKLLIVDDSIFVFEEMKRMLEDTSYEIVGYAKTGEEVVDQYEKLSPDIITLDIILPGIDGFETAALVVKKWPDAKIIMISSLAYDDTKKQAMEIGVSDFIFKPVDKKTLIASLNRVAGISEE